ALPSASYSGSSFNDIWFNGPKTFMTGTFTPGRLAGADNIGPREYFVTIPHMRNQYEASEKVRFGLYVAPADYRPAVVTTASLEPFGVVVTKAYYRIDNDRTEGVVVPFGTGSTETTRLSYDS